MSTTEGTKDEGLAAIVEGHAPGERRRRRWIWLALAGVAVLLVAGFCSARSGSRAAAARFRTEEATRGELVVKVTATGKLQPLNQVDVGSEVSGLVESVFVDDNDYVKKGEGPAKTERDTAEATLARAIANQAGADAAVRQCRASVSSAETNLSKASIRSPIDGVVLSREVEPGQTVAASFQGATPFTLAEDLKAEEPGV